MSLILWPTFDWPVIATFATGFAAVGAALIVGLRQSAISTRQSEILELQIAQARESADRDYHMLRQRFRLDMLERRLSVVQDFRELWVQWSMQGSLDEEQWKRLYRVFQSAQLLYPDDISNDLNVALGNLMNERISQKRTEDYWKRGDQKRADKHLEKSFEHNDQAREMMASMLDRIVDETKILFNAALL